MTPWTVAYQAPLSIGFSRQEYWSGLPFPSSGDLPNPGIEPRSPESQADSLLSEPTGKPNVHTTLFKINNQQGPTVQHRELAQCYVAALIGGKFGGE